MRKDGQTAAEYHSLSELIEKKRAWFTKINASEDKKFNDSAKNTNYYNRIYKYKIKHKQLKQIDAAPSGSGNNEEKNDPGSERDYSDTEEEEDSSDNDNTNNNEDEDLDPSAMSGNNNDSNESDQFMEIDDIDMGTLIGGLDDSKDDAENDSELDIGDVTANNVKIKEFSGKQICKIKTSRNSIFTDF